MAVDKNKIIAEATKLIQKGAYDKAIQAYQKILADDPRDVRSLLKVGEIHQKKGDDKAAAAAFDKVAETYAEQGFFLKAVAVYKQIVKLDPDDIRVNDKLAGLYQQLGLLSDAMSQYQLMASAYERAGDGTRLADVLKRMIELDPENVASSIKLGELYSRASQPGPALECFRRAADHLKRHNRADEYLKVAERVAALEPGDHGLARELANIHLAKGDTKRALAKLQLCFKADPKDVETLQLLAQAFRDLGQGSKTLSVYKELARVHEERGRPHEARSVWRKVQELSPDDEEAAHALGQGASAPAPEPDAPAAGASRGAQGQGRAPVAGPAPGAARPGVIAPPPPAASGAEAIAKLLAETDVYVKYGLHDKALDHLSKVLALDPQSVEAHERARDIHLAAGRPQDAGREAAAVARGLLAAGRTDRAREAVARLRQIAPDHPELHQLAAAAGGGATELRGAGEEEIVVAGGEAPDGADEDALALAAATAEDEEIVEDEAPATPVEGVLEGEGVGDDEEALTAARASAADEVVEDEGAEEAPPARTRGAALRKPVSREPAAREPGRAAAGAGEEPDLSDEIEEADFFVQQGLLDDAREALRNLLAFYPGHAAVEAKLAELERRGRSTAGAPPALGRPPPADESFDIARELADELGPSADPSPDDEFQYSVEDVFNQFKKGVEQTVRREDSATHYDLGIAYKEMGLLDDAVHEFEVALDGNDRTKEVDCLSMIGLCRIAKGEPREAVKAYRRALASDHLTREAAKAIHYDLAAAYEESGERDAALYYFQRVARADPGYRDAPKRAAALGGGPGRPPPDVARSAPRASAAGAPGGPSRPSVARPAAPAPPAGGAKKNIGYL